MPAIVDPLLQQFSRDEVPVLRNNLESIFLTETSTIPRNSATCVFCAPRKSRKSTSHSRLLKMLVGGLNVASP